MINRELIRSKVVQTYYAFAQNEGKDTKVAEQELALSLSKSHEMYLMLLQLLVEIGHIAQRLHEVKVKRAERLREAAIGINPKFVQNRFLKQLEDNNQLIAFRETLSDNLLNMTVDFARKVWSNVEQSTYFLSYMQSKDSSFEEDRDLFRAIYRNEICNNDKLEEAFEDLGLYWNDDKAIVDTFVLKTIAKFTADSAADHPLMPEFRKDEDREYAVKLLQYTLSNTTYYDQLIAENTRNWELDRVALMDRIIIHTALAEIISFPSIPVNVSINEYVELAKIYSTPKSWRFVNGTLDNIVKQLSTQHKIVKDQAQTH